MSSEHVQRAMWALIAAAAEERTTDISPILDTLDPKDFGSLTYALAALAGRSVLPDILRYSPLAQEMTANAARAEILNLTRTAGDTDA